MKEEWLLERLSRAVTDMDEAMAERAARIFLKRGFDCGKAIEIGLGKGMARVGELYESGEYFIPDLLSCAETMEKAAVILKRGLKGAAPVKGRVVIGTISGDTHDIGKNIVALFISAAGYELYDLGKDVSAEIFIEKGYEFNAQVIAVSTLMSSAMKRMKEIIDILNREGKRECFKVIVGGAPVSEEFAKQIGADGYAESGVKAVKLLDALLGFAKEKELRYG
jgi:methylmalonyl-CoA mutase cobalamin-binding domain/chain